jgi:hypothetical protein
MHISIGFSLARRKKVPQNRLIPTCLCQDPDQPPEEKLQLKATSKIDHGKLGATPNVPRGAEIPNTYVLVGGTLLDDTSHQQMIITGNVEQRVTMICKGQRNKEIWEVRRLDSN